MEFKAEILDESGSATSANLGHTYRKLLCVAFDLAVLRAHLNDKFPRFVQLHRERNVLRASRARRRSESVVPNDASGRTGYFAGGGST